MRQWPNSVAVLMLAKVFWLPLEARSHLQNGHLPVRHCPLPNLRRQSFGHLKPPPPSPANPPFSSD